MELRYAFTKTRIKNNLERLSPHAPCHLVSPSHFCVPACTQHSRQPHPACAPPDTMAVELRYKPGKETAPALAYTLALLTGVRVKLVKRDAAVPQLVLADGTYVDRPRAGLGGA